MELLAEKKFSILAIEETGIELIKKETLKPCRTALNLKIEDIKELKYEKHIIFLKLNI